MTAKEEHRITNDEQLRVTIEQMGRMYSILQNLSQEMLPQSREWFAVMAEGPVDYIRELNEQVNAYITEITKPLAEEAEALEAQKRAERLETEQEEKTREEIAA
jgi:hypothetical protein